MGENAPKETSVDTALEIVVAGVRKRLDTQGERPESEGEEYDDKTIGKDPGVETVLCKLGSQRVGLAKSYALRNKKRDSAVCPASSPGKGNTESFGLRMAESQCSTLLREMLVAHHHAKRHRTCLRASLQDSLQDSFRKSLSCAEPSP